jgi:fatty-acid desaturase
MAGSTLRMLAGDSTSAVDGRVVWQPGRSLWTGSMTIAAVVLGPASVTWDALALFLATCAVTLCAGHSVGMHRLLIHRSFTAPLWLEHLLVYLGTLVGMAGPIGMMRLHDLRDWAQRQEACHDLHAHRRPFLHDAFWQMHCGLALARPPRFVLEPRVASDRFYRFLERSWMLQQAPWALLFWSVGGLPWLVWGVPVRVAVSLTGHWLVGHYAHRRGHQGWVVDGAAVQGYNIRHVGLVTFGEAWHGNHHAFPDSARLGIEPGQADPGWWLLCALARVGLVSGLRLPADLPPRPGLRRVDGYRDKTASIRSAKPLQLFSAANRRASATRDAWRS